MAGAFGRNRKWQNAISYLRLLPLDVGNYAFGSQNEDFRSKFGRNRKWQNAISYLRLLPLAVGNYAFGSQNEDFHTKFT